jgi:peptide/nickel transport system ATP-binding protein
MTDAPLLELDGLCKDFPVRNAFGRKAGVMAAVDHVSLTIARGEVYGLAGESGSGKSTIARMVMGLEGPTSGRILMEGKPVTASAGTGRFGRRVQMVFQNPGSSLNPRRRIGQSVEIALASHGYASSKRAARIAELLDLVGLPADFADRYPHELSGGQKQRVAIARALAVEPELLILDEPT